MKFVNTVLVVLALSLLGATLAPGARADEWNKKTILTFSQPVEIPGQILPAGTYTFKLLDSPADRHIVQIFNADGTQIIATVLAINDYRLKPTGRTVVSFAERSGLFVEKAPPLLPVTRQREDIERLVRKFNPVERDFRNRKLGREG